MEYKIVFNPSIARQMLHKGNPIIDIKKNRDNPRETVFIFEKTEKFRQDLTSIINKEGKFSKPE